MRNRALWGLGICVLALVGGVITLRQSGALPAQAATHTPGALVAANSSIATQTAEPTIVLPPTRTPTPGPLIPRVFLPMQLSDYLSAPPPDDSPFSVSDRPGGGVWNSPQSLNLAITAGIKYSRIGISWAMIEPTKTTPPQFQWQLTDLALNNLLAQGIQPLVLVFHAPGWAATTDCGPVHNTNDMAELFAALVTRYPTIKYWTLYNEVDGAVYSTRHSSSGGCYGQEDDLDGNGVPDYEDYAHLARDVWKAMHTANPNAQLVIANLAFDNFTPDSQPLGYPSGCCFNYRFLDHMLNYMQQHPLPGGDKYGDVLGFNDYLAYNLAFWEHHSTAIGVGAKADAIKQIEAKYGFDFPLLITEMSAWPTYPSKEGVPQETQARQMVQMFGQMLYYKILVGTWWTWDDYPDTNCGVAGVQCDLFKYGLVDVHLTPKESYDALRILVTQLRGYAPTDAVINNRYVDLGFTLGEVQKRFIYARTDTFSNRTVGVTLSAQQVQVTDMQGNVTSVFGNKRGQVTLQVTANPVYVQINPR